MSKADEVEVGLPLSEVVVVEEGASLSLSVVEEAAIVVDWSFEVAKEDWPTETRMAELIIDKVSVEVCDNVELKSLFVSSAFTGQISEDGGELEVQRVAVLIADNASTMFLYKEKAKGISRVRSRRQQVTIDEDLPSPVRLKKLLPTPLVSTNFS